MLELMRRHYAGVQPDRFFADLALKQWAILLHDREHGRLCGFSTQTLLTVEHHGGRAHALFTGDTIVDRGSWADAALGNAWGRLALELIDRSGHDTLDWYLISQGFRTYRYLALFFREFYPRFDLDMPPAVIERTAALARHLFGDRYDAVRNVVRADAESYSLRSDLAQSCARAASDPHVAFFLEQNPGHVIGDELCCLAPLTRENFTRAAWRVIERRTAVDVNG